MHSIQTALYHTDFRLGFLHYRPQIQLQGEGGFHDFAPFSTQPCEHMFSQTARARKLIFCTMNESSQGTHLVENEFNRLNIMVTSGKKSIILSIFAICEVTLQGNFTRFDIKFSCTNYFNSSNIQLNQSKNIGTTFK